MTRIAFRVFTALTILSAFACAFFYAKVREREVVMDYFVHDATRGIAPTDTVALVLAVSRDVYQRTNRSITAHELSLYERIESTSFFNVTSTVSLLRGTYGITGHTHIGPCGTMSRAMLGSLWNLGIPARKLQLLPNAQGLGGGHTMLEFLHGGRWCVISPSDSTFTWLTRDGRIATVEEIQGDTAVFAQIFGRYPNYPYRFDNPAHIRWTKFPPAVQRMFHALLGDKGYRTALTPVLYDQPRRLFWYTSIAAFALFGLVALLLRARIARRPPGETPRPQNGGGAPERSRLRLPSGNLAPGSASSARR